MKKNPPEIDSPNYSCHLFLSGEIMRIYSLSLYIFLLSQRGLENKCFFNTGNIFKKFPLMYRKHFMININTTESTFS